MGYGMPSVARTRAVSRLRRFAGENKLSPMDIVELTGWPVGTVYAWLTKVTPQDHNAAMINRFLDDWEAPPPITPSRAQDADVKREADALRNSITSAEQRILLDGWRKGAITAKIGEPLYLLNHYRHIVATGGSNANR